MNAETNCVLKVHLLQELNYGRNDLIRESEFFISK